MEHTLHERTILVSLYTADEESKSDLQGYLREVSNAHRLFLKVISDESADAPARVMAIETLCEYSKSPAIWNSASGIVDKLVTDKNAEIASAAAKYATNTETLTTALDHESPLVRKVAARRLRQISKSKIES